VVTGAPAPYALIAELTHRCPLRCVYCANPTSLVAAGNELSTVTWSRVFAEGADLGVIQVHLSGGEPLLRRDLTELVDQASRLGCYTNLITSGLGLSADRATELADAGLRSVQVSIQAHDDHVARVVSGSARLAAKRAAADAVLAAGLPLTINVVVHRLNLDHLAAIIDLAVDWGASRIELANVQYYGWALLNASALLPTRDQLEAGEAIYRQRRADLAGQVEVQWIVPDWFEEHPQACMGGWATQTMTVTPDGIALPCPAAACMADLEFPTVMTESLQSIWTTSTAFSRYRGTAWLPAPCQTCDRREIDLGGCRCQAYALLGDGGLPDPVCTLTQGRRRIDDILSAAHDRGASFQLRHRLAIPENGP
jgi:pyrroloquinoline quinone biosynthesis protein E